jgi:hypothetical protein
MRLEYITVVGVLDVLFHVKFSGTSSETEQDVKKFESVQVAVPAVCAMYTNREYRPSENS